MTESATHRECKCALPYNGDIQLLGRLGNELPAAMEHVVEIFLPPPKSVLGSGRVVPQGEHYPEEVRNVIADAGSRGIVSNVLMNAGCLGTLLNEPTRLSHLYAYLESLHGLGPIRVTVSDFVLAMRIKEALPKTDLECSVTADVDTISAATYWFDIGCRMIAIPPRRNKDMAFICELRRSFPEVRLKMIVNTTCLPSCPMERGHTNLQGHDDDNACYLRACSEIYRTQPWLFYSGPFIPPEMLCRYDGLIDIWKILDRTDSTGKIMEALGVYTGCPQYLKTRAKWNDWIPQQVFDRVTGCDRNCARCEYCRSIYESKTLPSNSFLENLLADPRTHI